MTTSPDVQVQAQVQVQVLCPVCEDDRPEGYGLCCKCNNGREPVRMPVAPGSLTACQLAVSDAAEAFHAACRATAGLTGDAMADALATRTAAADTLERALAAVDAARRAPVAMTPRPAVAGAPPCPTRRRLRVRGPASALGLLDQAHEALDVFALPPFDTAQMQAGLRAVQQHLALVRGYLVESSEERRHSTRLNGLLLEELRAIEAAVRTICPTQENEGWEEEDTQPMYRCISEHGSPLIEATSRADAILAIGVEWAACERREAQLRAALAADAERAPGTAY